MVRPITPQEITGEKVKILPPAVLLAFNELITEKYDGGTAQIKQDEVIDLILQKMGGMGGLDSNDMRNEIFSKGWLNVEGIYRDAGWNVEYDKPGYCETYPATFTFTRKK